MVVGLTPFAPLAPAIGDAAGQATGIALGVQDKFSWKSVALSVATAGVTQGLSGPLSSAGQAAANSLPAALGTGIRTFVEGAVTQAGANLVTQGIGVATGLQKKFDWAGVAIGGVVGGVSASGTVNRFADSLKLGDNWAGQAARNGVVGLAGGVAGAATRSVVTGTNFGDNLTSVLPDVIAITIGNAVAGRVLQAPSAGGGDDVARAQTEALLRRKGLPPGSFQLASLREGSSPYGGADGDVSEVVVKGRRLTLLEKLGYDLTHPLDTFRRLSANLRSGGPAMGSFVRNMADNRIVQALSGFASRSADTALFNAQVNAATARAAVATAQSALGQTRQNLASQAGSYGPNFSTDYANRRNAGLSAMGAALTRPSDPQYDAVVGLANRRMIDFGSGAVGYITSPIWALGDAFVGRPVAGALDTANRATGIAPGYRADPYAITDFGSVVLPMAASANALRAAGSQALLRTGGLVRGAAAEVNAPEFVTVFRGDRVGTTIIKSNAAREGGYASSQRIIDSNNLDDLFRSHALDSSSPPSSFISVTTDLSVARFFAGPSGVVNEFRIPVSRATPNPLNNYVVPAGPSGRLVPEAELLVPNYIRPSEFVRRR